MFEVHKLKKELKTRKAHIAELEQKRIRSQASIIEAMISSVTPDKNDVDYFNDYTAQIKGERLRIMEIQKKLDTLTHREAY